MGIWASLQRHFRNGDLCSIVVSRGRITQACPIYSVDFSYFLQIVATFLAHLQQDKFTTYRDIYYLNVQLFGSQRVCNRAIDVVSASLNWDLSTLGIVPSQKGLIYGKGTLVFDSKVMRLQYGTDPCLIPIHKKCEVYDVDFVVVIEKDAVFQWFCRVLQNSVVPFSFLVVTGKGFPDRLTKRTVQAIAATRPVLAFVDADVYGICICKSYDVPSLRYCGMFLLESVRDCLDITARERTLLVSQIVKTTDEQSGSNVAIRRELTRSLFLGKKAELNLSGSSERLQTTNYILKKINDFVTTSVTQDHYPGEYTGINWDAIFQYPTTSQYNHDNKEMVDYTNCIMGEQASRFSI